MGKKYSVILADPPWDWKVWNEESGLGRSAAAHYPVMATEEICKMPIKSLASENCALFMWAIWPKIFDSKVVAESWGFEYSTLAFEWLKLGRNWSKLKFQLSMLNSIESHDLLEKLLFFGMGHYTRANPEPCLLFTRGSVPVATRKERNVLFAPIGRHSEKPDGQYGKIENLYPNARRLELFARKRRVGWDSFGNEVDGSVVIGEKKSEAKSKKAEIQMSIFDALGKKEIEENGD